VSKKESIVVARLASMADSGQLVAEHIMH